MVRKQELAKRIDHTLLGATASREGVETLCAEAIRYGFASVCVNPCHVRLAATALEGSPIPVCAVIGFPHGMSVPAAKAFEAERAVEDGARELDMVINVAALKEGDYETVIEDIRAVCSVRGKAPGELTIKVILETGFLEDEETATGAVLAKAAGADFVKTSTGFGPSGATTDDVALMRRTVGPEMGVKAAGGIRDYETAAAMIAAGATRIGASRSIELLEGADD